MTGGGFHDNRPVSMVTMGASQPCTGRSFGAWGNRGRGEFGMSHLWAKKVNGIIVSL